MKKFILALLLIFNTVFVLGQNAATCTLPIVTNAVPGTVTVPVTVTEFNNIAAFTIYFEYDPAVLTYSSSSNPNTELFPGLEVSAFVVGTSNQIGITWSASGGTGSTLPNGGTLVNIVFNYVSGTGNFTFLQSICEVTNNDYETVAVLYTDGSIAPLNPASVSIPELTNQAAPTNGLLVPVNVNFLTIAGGVNSFTFVVAYDETKLTYQNLESASLSGIEILQLTNPTRLVIEWLDASSAGSQLDGQLLELEFNYIGGTSALAFDENLCHIGDHNALEVPAVYTDGLVSQDLGTVVNVTAGTKNAAPGAVVLIPITASNFTDIGAFDFLINYDLSVLSFTGLENINPLIPQANLATNITATGVGINWQASATALNITSGEKLFDLKFTYTSGSTTLKFDQALSAVSNFELTALTVNYLDGAVNEISPYTATAVMPDVVAVPLTTIDVPINATGFAGIGAFDLVVGYDVTALEFKGVFNPLASLSSTGELTYNAIGGKVYISWAIDPAAVTGLTIADNEKLFDMQFAYNAGSSVLAFDQTSCVVSKFDLNPVIVSYTDGSVEGGIQLNLNLFLEGLYNPATGLMNKAQDYVGGVTVDKFTGTIADQIIVELHNTANYATTVHAEATVNLNTDGTASLTIPSNFSGSYYVTVKQRNHIETTSASPVSFASFKVPYDFTTAANKAYGNNMKLVKTGVWGLFAGDVDQDGNININDGGPINTGIKIGTQGYLATDINGDGVVNINDVGPVNISIKSGIAVSKP